MVRGGADGGYHLLGVHAVRGGHVLGLRICGSGWPEPEHAELRWVLFRIRRIEWRRGYCIVCKLLNPRKFSLNLLLISVNVFTGLLQIQIGYFSLE